MIVILEGPDGAGKTYLANELQNAFSLAYHHEGPPPEDVSALQYYGDILESMRGKDVVIDRFALGERVYGPVLRGKDGLGEDGWRVFQRLAAAVGAIQIVCLPPPEVCWSYWREGQNELFDDEIQFWKTYAAYGYYAQQSRVYDYTTTSLEEFTYGWVTEPAWTQPGIIGSPYAKCLLVTEQSMFSTLDPSKYLTQAIDAAGIHDWELAWMSTHGPDGHLNPIPNFNPDNEPLKIIALGDQVARRCKTLNVSFSRMASPQYWMKFYPSEVKGYGETIRKEL